MNAVASGFFAALGSVGLALGLRWAWDRISAARQFGWRFFRVLWRPRHWRELPIPASVYCAWPSPPVFQCWGVDEPIVGGESFLLGVGPFALVFHRHFLALEPIRK